ncbi:hypothetical protein AVEN_48611-1 [Araneus ventricosus]|uniref:Transposable element Tc1 transposase n=1 Tax=Araneus ventricosus TaxID=182803 RepID=A0A4Y2PD39_ARAVE|nr:hypothetical protein AVEN_48611-1 [Araneus ventricosus]
MNDSLTFDLRRWFDCGYFSLPVLQPSFFWLRKIERLCWAREHIGCTLDDRENVAWSDKSLFQLLKDDGMVRVCRRPHEVMDPSCQQGAAQVGGGSIMVWAVFTWHRLGPLAKLNQ